MGINLPRLFFQKILVSVLILSPAQVFAAEQQLTESKNEGVTAFNNGHYSEAETYFLLKLKEPALKNESLMYLSRIAMEKSNADTAIKYIEQALTLEPNSVDEFILSGNIYCGQAQKSSIFTALKLAKTCIAQYDAAVNMAPENIEALVSAIKFHLNAPSIAGGSTKRGNELLDRLSRLSPEDADTCRLPLVEKEKGADSALALADELSKKGFKSAENQYQIAHYYKEKKLYTKAQPLFEPLLNWKETPKNKWFVNDSWLQLGEIYLTEGKDLAQGVKLIENYKKKNSNSHDVHYFWSTWSLAKGYKALGEKDKYDALVKSIKSEDYKQNKAFAKEFESSI